jgi:hypothetical protein
VHEGPLIGEIWHNASQWLAGDQMDSVVEVNSALSSAQ